MNKRIKKLRRELDLTQEKFGARKETLLHNGNPEEMNRLIHLLHLYVENSALWMNGFVLEQALCMLQSQQQSWMRSRRNLI